MGNTSQYRLVVEGRGRGNPVMGWKGEKGGGRREEGGGRRKAVM